MVEPLLLLGLLVTAQIRMLLVGNRLVKHRVDGSDGGSGYCGRNFPLSQRCIHLSKRVKLGH